MSYFALIPAGGGGTRMGAEMPKQYLPLAGRPLIRHAVDALLAVPAIARVFVVLAPDDAHWSDCGREGDAGRLCVLRCGGATRAASVTNGLRAVRGQVADDDWVLVHDAARPCLLPEQVERLLTEVGEDPVGGLLAVPLSDTLKRARAPGADGVRVAETVPREGLWQAQTPQMFRYGLLTEALEHAPAATDEASAVEALGLHPKLVAADARNLKVTFPLDLHLAELIVRDREN